MNYNKKRTVSYSTLFETFLQKFKIGAMKI